MIGEKMESNGGENMRFTSSLEMEWHVSMR